MGLSQQGNFVKGHGLKEFARQGFDLHFKRIQGRSLGQGKTFDQMIRVIGIQQKANAMYSSERRRLFLISLEDTGSTMNAQSAFLRNLNLVVNSNDLPQLPMILNRALNDFNDLYNFFNKSMGLMPV